VVLDLVIQAAAEPVPERRAGLPVRRGHHLFIGPMRRGRRDQPILDVVHDEDVLEVVPAERHEHEALCQRGGPPVEVDRQGDVDQQPEELEREQGPPVGTIDRHANVADGLVHEVLDVADIPLHKQTTNDNHRSAIHVQSFSSFSLLLLVARA
jgi:hypothetical protein